LSASGDKDYPQAPFTTVHTPKEIVDEYGDASIFASGVIETALDAFAGNLWKACDCILGFHDADDETKKKWVEKAKGFAEKYFDKDVRKMTYCLKDCYNWYTWVNLKKAYKDVDYSLMVEEEDNTNFEGESACVGGKCLI
jgi:ribonucleoside-diphosphate reductase alpha chain